MSPTDDDLRVGRDPNDTTWLVVRYADDWAKYKARLRDLAIEALGPRLVLAPWLPPAEAKAPLCPTLQESRGVKESDEPLWGPSADLTRLWLPLSPIASPSGDEYRSDMAGDRVLRRRRCEADFSPLPCFGGTGFETGRLRRPVGLALDGRGLLYVADACNHRVQVVRPESGEVVIVLGRTDGTGRPVAGTTGGAMIEPVAVAVDPCNCAVFVADRMAGLVHVFNQRFQWQRSFAPLPDEGWPQGREPAPVGVALDADGTLLIADASWPRLLAADARGERRPERPMGPEHDALFPGLRGGQRFAPEGEVVVGPLDSGVYDAAWHQLIIEGHTPAGTAILAQTFASNDSAAGAAAAWAPAEPVPIDLDHDGATGLGREGIAGDPDRGSFGRLILSDSGRWRREVHGEYRRDRPLLARWTSSGQPGPAKDARTMTLPLPALARVRAGDTVRLGDASHPVLTEEVTLAPLPPVAVTVSVSGLPPVAPPPAAYGASATVTLTERGGRAFDPGLRLYELTGAEQIHTGDLDASGTMGTVALPHGVAAFLESGDVIALSQGGLATTHLAVSAVLFPVAVTLSATGDLVDFAGGARVVVRRRGGVSLPAPITLYRLLPGEHVDLRTLSPAVAGPASLPAAAATLLRAGDELTLDGGGHSAALVVNSIDPGSGVVAFAPAAARSYAVGSARLIDTPGRLVVADTVGFEDPLPAGDRLLVFNETGINPVEVAVLLAEPERGAIWLGSPGLSGAVTAQRWALFRAPAAVATDRGQYLWVRLRLLGRREHPGDLLAVESPSVRALRPTFARPSLLALLPATFSRRDDQLDPSGALFLERFLTLFEGQLTRAESRYEDFSRLLNATAAPAEWLSWLASWLDVVFDPRWPIERRRRLLLHAVDLYRRRGTPASILDWVEICTGRRPELLEGFRVRHGNGTVLGAGGPLGCSLLLDEPDTSGCSCQPRCCGGGALAHHFTLFAEPDDACHLQEFESVLRDLVESIKPAHTDWTLQLVAPDARLGVQSTVGLDFVLGEGAPPPSPTILGQGIPPVTGGRFRPILGLDLRLGGAEPAPHAGVLGGPGMRVEQDLALK